MIKYFLAMKDVQRMSGKSLIRGYNNQEHSYMVTSLFMHFAKLESIPITIEDIEFVNSHDILETVTGDLTYEIKNLSDSTKKNWERIENESVKSHPDLIGFTDRKKLSSEKAQMLFKVCDYLDLWLFCKKEQVIGNRSWEIRKVISKCEELIIGKFYSVDQEIYSTNFDTSIHNS